MMSEPAWEHVEHDADIGLRATADSRATLFETMAQALTAVITDPAGVERLETVEVACEAPDDALLLVDWLNAIVFEMATRRMLFSGFEVTLDGHQLSGTLSGESVDRARHRPVVEVKGATYTALSFDKDADGRWHAECVVDV